MAAVTRQPFAPLNEARLQNLTSLKNRQNTPAPAGKRKAEIIEFDDAENVDPLLSAKRSKANKSSPAKDGFVKPVNNYVLKAVTKTVSTPLNITNRRTITPKSPAARLSTAIVKSSPLTAPAGRSPTRKRAGLLGNRRRTLGPYSRVDPPSFNVSGGAAPFSLDAALKGTIPGYAARPTPKVAELEEPDMKASWFFEIHEDTHEQEMTNLLQHSTCTLDISSDEENSQRATRELKEDKENMPPVDDVSQTSRRTRHRADEMVVEKERKALGEMDVASFYADGCDAESVVIVPEDESLPVENVEPAVVALPETKAEDFVIQEDVDALMSKAVPLPAQDDEEVLSLLEPIESTEAFELWESGSAKDEGS